MESFFQTLWAVEAKNIFWFSVLGIGAVFVLFVRWAEKEQNKMLLGGSFVLAFFALYAFLFLFPHPGKDQPGLVIGNLSEIVAATVGLMVTAAASLYAIRIAQAAKRLAEEDRRQSEQERVERFLDKAYVTNATIQNQLNAAHFEAINLPRLYHNERLVFLLDYFQTTKSTEGYFNTRDYIDAFVNSTTSSSDLYSYKNMDLDIPYDEFEILAQQREFFASGANLERATFLDENEKVVVASQYEKVAQSLIDLLEPAVTSYEHRALLFNDTDDKSYTAESLARVIGDLRSAKSAIKTAILRESFAVEQARIDWILRLYSPHVGKFSLLERDGRTRFIVFLATLALTTKQPQETESSCWPRIEAALHRACEMIHVLTMAAKSAEQFENFINSIFLGDHDVKNKTLEELRFGPKGFQNLATTGLLNGDLRTLREKAIKNEKKGDTQIGARLYNSFFVPSDKEEKCEKFLYNANLTIGEKRTFNEGGMQTLFFQAVNDLALNGFYFPLRLDAYHEDIQKVICRLTESGLSPDSVEVIEPTDTEIEQIEKTDWDSLG